MKNIDCVLIIILLVFGRIQGLKNLINYQFIAWLSAYKDVLSNILQLKPVVFNGAYKVSLNIVENMKIIDCVLIIIRLVFGRIQARKNLINYQFIAWLSAYKDVLSNILQLKRVIFKSASKVSLNIVKRVNISKIGILIIRLVFGGIQALKNLINYQFIAWLSAYKDVLPNILQLKRVIFKSASKVSLNIVERVNISKIVILIIRLVFGRIQALKNLINYQFIAWLSAYKDVLSNILQVKPVVFNGAYKVSLNIVENMKIIDCVLIIIRLVFGRIQGLKNLINYQFIAWLSAYKDVLSNILQLKPVVFNGAYKVSLNIVENMKIIDCVLIIIRLVFGRIQARKNLINYQFIAWLSAYKDVLSNILQLKRVIFKSASKVSLNIVKRVNISKIGILIIRLVFGRIQALKNLINYQFIAWLSAYKDVLPNILQLKRVIFKSASKVSLNIVERVNISKIVILIIRLVFGRIQALKNLINYQFIAWLSAYKDVLSNILQLKPVIFKSFSKVSLNIVESVSISKIVILIIRLVFGRIQALKNLINYQFIAWLSAYKDVLSNILQLKPVTFKIFSNVGLNIVENMKNIDCVLLIIRLVFGRIQALKNQINYQFIAWLSAYKDVLPNILQLKPVIFKSASKVSLNIVKRVNISKIGILIIRLVFGRIQALKNLINYQFIAWLSAYKDVLSNILQLKPVTFIIFSKVRLNIVENMKIIDCVLLIIRLVFGGIQALKNQINYQFIAWLSAYKDVLSNILNLKPVVFNSASKVSLNIVESVNISKKEILIIRLIVGRIKDLKNLITYQFIAWLSAYKDVLSNILQLKPVIFKIFSNVGLNIVENMKNIDCVLLIIRLVFGRIQALKNLINYQFIAWLSAYKDVLSNILQLKPVIFIIFSKVRLNTVDNMKIID